MRKTVKREITLFLVLVLMLSLCACAQKQRTKTKADEPTSSAGAETLPDRIDQKTPEKQAAELEKQLAQSGFSEEAEQSIEWLRTCMDVPEMMFGVGYLGDTGEAADGAWLTEADQAMLQKYPFLSEIDTDHTIGSDDDLYCLLPLDENATVSVNLIKWDLKSESEEVIEVLYRSESGDPVLLFANSGDDALENLSYIQVQIVDNAGNSCVWYPQLDALGQIVPCLSENGVYRSFDFTEYGWLDTPSELTPWLDAGYSGVYASGLEGCWTTQASWDTGCTATYYLWFFSEDGTGGSVDLDWQYEGSDVFEEMWSGFWSLTSVMDGPSYVTITLSLVGGENYGIVDGPYYLTEMYPLVISPSGEEIVIGAGVNEICLPFMSKYDSQPCALTRNSWFTESPVG